MATDAKARRWRYRRWHDGAQARTSNPGHRPVIPYLTIPKSLVKAESPIGLGKQRPMSHALVRKRRHEPRHDIQEQNDWKFRICRHWLSAIVNARRIKTAIWEPRHCERLVRSRCRNGERRSGRSVHTRISKSESAPALFVHVWALSRQKRKFNGCSLSDQ